MKLESVPIKSINVGPRYRVDLGDVEELSRSLNEVGLLQPIGVDRYYTLVFGQRRLKAAMLLEWKAIDCHIVDIDSILAGEYTENQFRKAFTPSERAAIAKAVEAELGNRQGQRTELRGNCPEVTGKTSEAAAKKAGFTSEKQYRRAAKVVAIGAPEVVAAMDSGEVSIAAAEVIATAIPVERQADVVAMPKERRQSVVRDARAERELARRNEEVVVVRSFERWVKDVSTFSMDPKEFWDAVGRHHMPDFYGQLQRALNILLRLKEAHPNETPRPRAVGQHEETAERFPFMQGEGWRQSHVLAVRETLEKIPEPEREAAVGVLCCAKILAPSDAVELITNIAAKTPKERTHLHKLSQSEDPRDRSNALSSAAGLPPLPDPRLNSIETALSALGRASKPYPNDPLTTRLKGVITELKSIRSAVELVSYDARRDLKKGEVVVQ